MVEGLLFSTFSDAIFSTNGVYRYMLVRSWGVGLRCCFIGLNPSKAGKTRNDPTLIRCMNFARSWGYSGMYMLNLFAFRATEPAVMRAARDPVGRKNDAFLKKYAQHSDIVVACWGACGDFLGRAETVYKLLGTKQFYAIATTKDGHPRHPLRLPKTLRPQIWRPVC